ncbi:uncharacterized protein TNCV_2131341 [Trichonephila clavipes]|nr:uncharacterized protein TNCV_2131341 [Trichonephila clavipes]
MACDAEDCGFEMLNDVEIVTSVQEESDPVDDEMDEDEGNYNKESSKGPSNADVFSVLEIAMGWYEQQSECCPTQLLLRKRIGDLTAKKRRCTMSLIEAHETNCGKGLNNVYRFGCSSEHHADDDTFWSRSTPILKT